MNVGTISRSLLRALAGTQDTELVHTVEDSILEAMLEQEQPEDASPVVMHADDAAKWEQELAKVPGDIQSVAVQVTSVARQSTLELVGLSSLDLSYSIRVWDAVPNWWCLLRGVIRKLSGL